MVAASTLEIIENTEIIEITKTIETIEINREIVEIGVILFIITLGGLTSSGGDTSIIVEIGIIFFIIFPPEADPPSAETLGDP